MAVRRHIELAKRHIKAARFDFSSELAYLLGLILLSLGTAMMERANFGMSMVVAPPYLLHLKISQYLPFFSFGMAVYSFQAVLLILLALIMRRFKVMYLLSFVTAVIYGLILDNSVEFVALWPGSGIFSRLFYYVLGMIVCAAGIAFLVFTYIATEAYEMFVDEISVKYRQPIGKVKTIYDVTSCALGIILSFAFFGLGHFEGVKLGTIFCALINGGLIGFFTQLYLHYFTFNSPLPKLRKFYRRLC